MSYRKQIQEIKDNIRKEIIQEATIKNIFNGNDSDGVLQLNNKKLVWTHKGSATIEFVDCGTGDIFGTVFNEIVKINCDTISLDDLLSLHEAIVLNKQYLFKQL